MVVVNEKRVNEDGCAVCRTTELRLRGIFFWKPPGCNVFCENCAKMMYDYFRKIDAYSVMDKRELRELLKKYHPDTGFENVEKMTKVLGALRGK